MDGWKGVWIDECLDGWMDEWMGVWVGGMMCVCMGG